MTCHLHAFASYAIMVGCFELSIAWRAWRKTRAMPWSDLLVPGLQFVPPVVMFFLLSSTANRAGETMYFGLMGKAQGLVDIFNNYSTPLDVATFLVLALLLGAGLYTRRVDVHRDMRLSLVLLFILYWAMPDQILSSFYADRRLIVFVALLLVACMDLRLEKMRARTALVGMLMALFVVRMGLIVYNWHQAEKVFAPVLSLMDEVKEGSRVMALVGGDIAPSIQNPPLDHLSNMLVVKKNVYINSLFAEPGQQPLRVVTGAKSEFSISPSQTQRVKEKRFGTANPFPDIPWERFDYLLILNPVSFVKEVPSYLKPIRQAGMATLYRVDLPYRPQ
jgi:hypothetical protein